ncbi:MAG: GGDEF domain-containing protein [Oligoflexia bacterium]|nr:GGDEF domain-containing protein [Oligoflexia bacterium]
MPKFISFIIFLILFALNSTLFTLLLDKELLNHQIYYATLGATSFVFSLITAAYLNIYAYQLYRKFYILLKSSIEQRNELPLKLLPTKDLEPLAELLNEKVLSESNSMQNEWMQEHQSQLLQLNKELAQKLFENRVMLAMWNEQNRAEDSKAFLAKVLEEMLLGLPFTYGCVIIRPLAQIGPEIVIAKMEKKEQHQEIAAVDVLERTEKTLWLTAFAPKLRDFLLEKNDQSIDSMSLVQSEVISSIMPEDTEKELSIVSISLAQGKQSIGSLHLISDRADFSLEDSQKGFLLNVATQISLLLENRSLQYATRVDPLTRLYNRGYMTDRLREEILRTSRTGNPFSFLMMDLDHFKKINDTYGHQAGDDVLVSISTLLKKTCRASDAICRYGGEEIAIILVETPLEGAKIFADNLLKKIREDEIVLLSGKEIHISASIGIAEFPKQSSNGEELIQKADQALYEAKKNGRDCWKVFEL